ncbi:uncharacterized protein LOC135333882 isoform X4 [Halichondria panicea]|uniref:uncharacterized protein LOC135333882 isoform X4 n=1 Tax=Halichondria panicea TaxID=6063 RepID=UPI00312BA177
MQDIHVHSAAWAGNLSALKDAIKRGEDVNSVDRDGWTPLMFAAMGGHTDCAGELLSSGAVVDLANKGVSTPLYWAARGGHTDCVKKLLSSGAVVDLANKDGWTPLMLAAMGGHTDCAGELLSSGAVVDLANKDGETPLMATASCGHTDCARKLLSSGAVVDLADKDGDTSLIGAAMEGHTDCARELLSSGAVVDLANKDGYTPLYWAAMGGYTDCVRELLSSGAVVDLANKDGCTPLYWAAYKGHTDSVRELLSSGAVVDLADKDGNTPLMVAAYMGHEDTVKELLSSGASPLCSNNYGYTALMNAKESPHSNPSVIKLLKEAGESHSRPQSVPVLPKNWTVVTDTETKKPVYQNKAAGETLYTPPGYPLHQTSAHPDVTFFGEPQEKEFTSSGGLADFDNGVQVTVPANAVPAGTSVSIKVQPSLAPKDVFVMPEGIRSASPSYLISGEGLNGEVTLSMEHHVRVSTQQEADDLLFLQADSSPKKSGSINVYKYQEVQEGGSKAEFTPGGNTGRLTRRLSKKKFVKVGFRNRIKERSGFGTRRKKWFRGSSQLAASQSDDPPEPESPPNLYTVRVYRSPPHTTEDRLAIIVASLCGSLYSKFLETLDKVIIPRDYPNVSREVADRTTQESLTFVDMCATLNIHPVQGWSVEPDKKLISHSEVDKPEVEKFRPEDIHNYPPRIICRLFPEENAPKRTTFTISLFGLLPPVEFYIPLTALTPKVAVDTTKLQEATDELRRSALAVSDTQLGFTVKSVVSLMERMTAALRASSLSEVTDHTDSIRTEIASVLVVTRRVVEECTVQSISENMGASLSKMETLSHQLCMVAKVKLRNCQEDQSEETAALVDLVENGANLLRAVDCLLRDIHTLSGVSGNAGYSVLVSCSEKIVQSLSEDPKALALHLLSAELITVSILEKTNEYVNETKREKATRLYTTLLGVVKHHPHKYHKFVSTLRLDPLHTDLVTLLDSKYT